jgi:uroporphyrinogen-III decarboxylase
MTYKERLLAAIKGKPVDELPVCPRLDLWYNANKIRGTLPAKYKTATLEDIIQDLDIGYNTTIPDFRALEHPKEEAFRALGIYQCADIAYRISFDLDLKIYFEGEELVTEYLTPYGTIRTRSLFNERMKRDGITISHVTERAFKSEADYPALEYIFRHARVAPRFEAIHRIEEMAGDRGFPIVWISSVASPMHYIQKQLMGFEQFFFEMYDHPEELAGLADAIGDMEEKIFQLMLQAPADVYRVGGNYDSMMQNPHFFREHLLPNLRDRADRLHAEGKMLLTHTDGENEGLLDVYLDCGFDIAESFCPAPMTRVSMKEAREVFGDRITVWGGVPSLLMLRESFTDYEFDKYFEEFFQAIGDGSRIIISIADTTPPDAEFSRIEKLLKKARGFKSAVIGFINSPSNLL